MPKTPLSPEVLKQNFSDYHPNYTHDEAVLEASRCLYCYDAPCTRACPTHIDIPRFIRQILHDNPLGSAETILNSNILGGSCARACPTEVLCEGACVDRPLAGAPVQIGRLQRYATDYALEKGAQFFEAGPATGRKVAVVGGGPSGLACAHALRRAGHAVTIFEAREVLGGLNTLGIAAYKISTEFSLREIKQLLDIGGIEVKLNSPVTPEKLDAIRKEFDAVFIGIGLGATAKLGIPGENLSGVWEALDFVFQSHQKPLHENEVGRNVVVIGAGNTAVDVSTEARRLGAETVTITYRRGDADMSAYAYEYAIAKADGIQFQWHAAPVEFVGEGGKLTGVKFIRTKLVGEGRKAQLENIAGSEFVIPCDMAVKALGQSPIVDLLAKVPGAKIERGRLHIEEDGSTGVPGLFAGGDCTSKGAEIVNAVQEGKVAGQAIDTWLKSAAKK